MSSHNEKQALIESLCSAILVTRATSRLMGASAPPEGISWAQVYKRDDESLSAVYDLVRQLRELD
jgi:hypothetical protein